MMNMIKGGLDLYDVHCEAENFGAKMLKTRILESSILTQYVNNANLLSH